MLSQIVVFTRRVREHMNASLVTMSKQANCGAVVNKLRTANACILNDQMAENSEKWQQIDIK